MLLCACDLELQVVSTFALSDSVLSFYYWQAGCEVSFLGGRGKVLGRKLFPISEI